MMSQTVVVTVKPNSSKGPLVEADEEGAITIFVREPATEGKANKAVGELLAKHLGVPKSKVALIGGATARTKRFRVD
ncbi:hypothetical protein GOAMR_54_00270 [Gordonia amarae NBRC 15530]|uniref:UPF0235 protein GOAMR_54_00270 n=2 Tax=Gordonia amarae TaxID=36821 RepID=G7GSE2_9ACTN|nr:hypothetical protein GOAMR_54_00270 [Gordonia amarae NBRC 15530]